MSKTYNLSVNRAISAANRFGPGRIDAEEATKIHRLISGRDRSRARPQIARDLPKQGPGGETNPKPITPLKTETQNMTAEQFTARLSALGHNISTAHNLLGIGRSTIYRMSKGTAKVPQVVERLMDMYEQFGIPEDHRG
jgi:DNA-binding NtrC family response regulator